MRSLVLCHCWNNADPDPDCEFCGGFGEVEVDDENTDSAGIPSAAGASGSARDSAASE
jgi:hypothetical protein